VIYTVIFFVLCTDFHFLHKRT